MTGMGTVEPASRARTPGRYAPGPERFRGRIDSERCMIHREGGAMDPERWHQVDRLFEEALDRPPAQRPAFLDVACAGDTALRREVERLLAVDEQGAGFLESTPSELLGLAFDDRG